MDEAGTIPSGGPTYDPQPQGGGGERDGDGQSWGRWVLLGVFGCLGFAMLAAVPPALVAYLWLRPSPDDQVLAEARAIVDESVRDARLDPRVTSVLGQPIRSYRRSFTSDFDLAGGEVDVVVDLRGPEGEGQLHLRMRRAYRQWRIEEVRFEELRTLGRDLLRAPPRLPDFGEDVAPR